MWRAVSENTKHDAVSKSLLEKSKTATVQDGILMNSQWLSFLFANIFKNTISWKNPCLVVKGGPYLENRGILPLTTFVNLTWLFLCHSVDYLLQRQNASEGALHR